jgi:lysophospholipase L1-like esterase
MRLFSNKLTLALVGLLILIVLIPLIVFLVLAQHNSESKGPTPGPVTYGSSGISQTPEETPTWPVISRNIPAFASSGYYPASYANDDSYDTVWRSQGTPVWLAYDLSSVPSSDRSKVLVVWYNESYDYNHTVDAENAYNLPQAYTIDVNPGKGGGKPPKTGWVTSVTVTGNHYHSRQHVIDMAGNNWIRIDVTAVDGATQNYDASINMDVYDARYGTSDDWIFYGDSITAGAMGHLTAGGVEAFAQLINAKLPRDFPVEESGGTSFLTSSDAAKYINTWLQLFPGKYVGLSYGTNDAIGCVDPNIYYNNYVTLVQAVLSAGKVPVVPHIPWGGNTNIQNCAPALNAKIDALYHAFPQIVKGPDLWTFFRGHQNLISDDKIHPTLTGFGALRRQWANAMLAAVYEKLSHY